MGSNNTQGIERNKAIQCSYWHKAWLQNQYCLLQITSLITISNIDIKDLFLTWQVKPLSIEPINLISFHRLNIWREWLKREHCLQKLPFWVSCAGRPEFNCAICSFAWTMPCSACSCFFYRPASIVDSKMSKGSQTYNLVICYPVTIAAHVIDVTDDFTDCVHVRNANYFLWPVI